MARIRSVDFLPEIFKTPTNQKFLSATLDQLIQEPKIKSTQGYIGRRVAPGSRKTDGYVLEPTAQRANYQLEPGIVFNDSNGNTVDALTYIGLVNGLKTAGANVDDHNRLFESDTYSWEPYIDFDKLVNYNQYCWVPTGPDRIVIEPVAAVLEKDFVVTLESEFTFTDYAGTNPAITLVRGGSYTFAVSQTGVPFYVQTHPGTAGTVPWASNISSRDIMGVTNNGTDNGVLSFDVPLADAHFTEYGLTDIGDVDFAVDAQMDSIADRLLSDVGSINGIIDIDNKTIVFLTTSELGWVNGGVPVTGPADRYRVYLIRLVYDINNENPVITLEPSTLVNVDDMFTVQYGDDYSGISFYKYEDPLTFDQYFTRVPVDTASLDVLYYQDATDPDNYGIINLINDGEISTLDVNEIIGQVTYTSPNGVEFSNGFKVEFSSNVTPAEYQNTEFFVEGVGTAITLHRVSDLIVPESYSISETIPWDINPWDSQAWDTALNAPTVQDYITINRSSNDRNAWSRSNRWFHFDILKKTAEYNGVVLSIDNNARATRPIIEFVPGIRLFNYGVNGRQPVTVIDFSSVDAFVAVQGQSSYTVDGYELQTDARVIFANDVNADVRNKVYQVTLVDVENNAEPEITLTLVDTLVTDDVVIVTNGVTLGGTVYSFDGANWVESQPKTSVNQPPLFDVFDVNSISFSNSATYPATTFTGTKVFSYAVGTGPNDAVLGFPVTYQSIGNLGDIVFSNSFYSDTFSYSNGALTTAAVSDGFVRVYNNDGTYINGIGWVNSVESVRQPQVILVEYTGDPIELDITPVTDLAVPAIIVTADNFYVVPSNYNVVGKTITFNAGVEIGATLTITVISDEVSQVGYYDVPINLSSNVFNENTSTLTLGTIRNHYSALAQNLPGLQGSIYGTNNLRDLGNVSPYGNRIVQHSAPVALSALFLRKKEYDFFSSVDFNASEYEKVKNRIATWVSNHDVYGLSAGEILELALIEINANKPVGGTFYWTDMLPSGTDFQQTIHQVTSITTGTFETLRVYDFNKAGTTALLVYHNTTLLTKDVDYTVANDGPRVTVSTPLTVGDTVTINEYSLTAGSNVPSTPTKLGLYPRFVPEKFIDDTYLTPTEVIRGHDGSITIAFGDVTDDVILEFEKRVYNNIKVNNDIPLMYDDVMPGAFNTTDYTNDEVVDIMTPRLLSWLGRNRIDYKTQDYRSNDARTWNYRLSKCKVGTTVMQGHWRGIYNRFYGTDAPHVRPWEMLGLTVKPSWWNQRYGTAPYTSGNLVLWDDIEAGLVKDPTNERVVEKYKRPGLTQMLPVDSEGNLLAPIDSVIGAYSSFELKKSWVAGDNAPAEAAWRKSSAWPFAVQQLLALTKPARYFTLMADRDNYTFDTDTGQYLLNSRYRLDSRAVDLHTSANPKHGYINWIIDYNNHYGYESTDQLVTDMAGLDVKLCHHMASFTDKSSLRVFADTSSPDSTSGSLILPDESYSLLMYKNQIIDEVTYSSVIVQRLTDGYAVIGNSSLTPYFTVYQYDPAGNTKNVTVGSTASTSSSVTIPLSFRDTVDYVPYGYVFKSKSAVANFIMGYAEYLRRAGMRFESTEASYTVNWEAMVEEFVYWADQNWAPQSVINLNPAASVLEFERELHIVDSLLDLATTEQPLDQNKIPLDRNDYVIDRIDNNFKLRTINGAVVGYLKFNLTSYEHLLVVDNTSIFNDLVYEPVTGLRQHRLRIAGFTTLDWNGQLDAQGFMYNEDNIKEWNQKLAYNKGEIVKFKNAYWSAAKKTQPTSEFDLAVWVKTDYAKINKGLLPNLATKADQKLHYYDISTANLESDIDLLAFGVTGYRARGYLQALDLDDISQVNIYSNLINVKGTPDSLSLFKGTTLNGGTVDYTVYENWAVYRAQYGATASRSYFELNLDGLLHNANPSVIEIVNSVSSSTVSGEQILVADIYKQSIKHNDTAIMPLLQYKNLDTSLPSAGFVAYEDVNLAVFSLADISPTDEITDQMLVWVAADSLSGWNVYTTIRMDQDIVGAIDNLDGTVTLEFSAAHELSVGNVIAVQDMSINLNGTHTVMSVSSTTQLEVAGELAKDQTVISNSTGSALRFEPSRVTTPSGIANSRFDNLLFATDKVWVDEFNGRAALYEKHLPYELVEDVVEAAGVEFGTSVAVGADNSGMLVGDPAANLVFAYDKDGDEFILNSTLSATANTNIANIGASVQMASTWGAVGAPTDLSKPGAVIIVNKDGTFSETQLLNNQLGTSTNFGQSVALSANEAWLYVGEPDANKVHAFQKVDRQVQTASFVGDGVLATFDVSADIVADTASQLVATVDGVPVTIASFVSSVVTLATVPAIDADVAISRRDLIQAGLSQVIDLSSLYGVATEEDVTVKVGSVLQRPYIDYSVTGGFVSLALAPLSNVTISTGSRYVYAGTITGTDGLGSSIDTTTNGSQVAISSPAATVDGKLNAGTLHVYDRVIERIVVASAATTVFTTTRTIDPNSAVFLNGVQLTRNEGNVNGQYSVSGVNEITLNAGVAVGDYLDIDTAEFQLIQSVTADTPVANATFGNAVSICRSKCSIYIGAQGDNEGQGSVTRLVNGARMYGYIRSNVQNPTVPANATLRINNIEVAISGDSASVAGLINAATIPNVTAKADNGFLVIELINKTVQSIANKLDVLPGQNVGIAALGLAPYYIGQVISSPVTTVQAQHFGNSVHIALDNFLVVGAINGDTYHTADAVTSDIDRVLGDSDRVTADNVAAVLNSGVVYTYDLLPDGTSFSEGKLVFGQQITKPDLSDSNGFGSSVDLVDDMLVVGSPGYAGGRVVTFKNIDSGLCWRAIKTEEDVVDTSMINSVYLFNKDTQLVDQYLDYIDPLNGKVLSAVQANIDYLTVYDPAVYQGTNSGPVWGAAQVGEIWWDLSTVRFLNYNQGTISDRAKVWGKTFNGSSVDVLLWTESNDLPDSYTGSGTVFDTTKYITQTTVDKSGLLRQKYYFWVKGVESIPVGSDKTLSADAIARYIESPADSGIAYATLINQNEIGLYNCKSAIRDTDTVLHVEYDTVKNDSNVYVEYDLIRDGYPDDFLSDSAYKKFLDSLCGEDSIGNVVPDIALSPADRYGVEFRPRRTMFVDRFAAIAEYLQKVNSILRQYTIAEMQTYPLLTSEEAAPSSTSGEWDSSVSTYTELTYQVIDTLAVGYRFLVESDSNNNGMWAIYEVAQASISDPKVVQQARVQAYDTSQLWSFADWVADGFSVYVKPQYVVASNTELQTISPVTGDVAKVTANSVGKWELHRYDGSWERVALENGTIELSSNLWDSTYGLDFSTELRYIVRSINEEIFTGSLAVERSRTLSLMFNFILAEQPQCAWLHKTSLIDVSQRVRSLVGYDVYQKDQQNYLVDYINETKPYHTKVKDFLFSYDGIDTFEGNVTDFDCPSTYSHAYQQYVSPILDAGAILITDPSNKLATDSVWTTEPWKQWYDNHLLELQAVVVTNPGSGYTSTPTVVVTGDAEVQATLRARVGATSNIIEIVVDDPGTGYASMPVITIVGGGGTGATAMAIARNDLVRSINTTIKFDRHAYKTDVVLWQPDTVYSENQLVRYNNAVYRLGGANGVDPSPAVFDQLADQVERVPADELNGLDRTFGYYVPSANEVGLDLALLIKGISFPGVEVDGLAFDTTFTEDDLDTIIESNFADTYLGTLPSDINIDGGAFIDEYHSHAPEELVPGSVFDTLDIRVISRPGADFLSDGHGFKVVRDSVVVDAVPETISFAELSDYPARVYLANITTGKMLYEGADFVVNWPSQSVTISTGVSVTDIIDLYVYEVGGSNQIYRNTLFGADVSGTVFNVPVFDTQVYKAVVFVNGIEEEATVTMVDAYTSELSLSAAPAADAFILVTVLGFTTPQTELSYPETTQLVYGTDSFDLGALVDGHNRDNAIVEVDGLRLRSSDGIRYYADGVTSDFILPEPSDYLFNGVSQNEVSVYVNQTLLTPGVDFTLSDAAAASAIYGIARYGESTYADPGTDDPRWVTLVVTPAADDVVDVYVNHNADYQWSGTELVFNVVVTNGSTVAVTTFNDTSELLALTEVFVGPTQTASMIIDTFDQTPFDSVPFDYLAGVDISVNTFNLTEEHSNPNHLWVTLNGERITPFTHYTLVDNQLTLLVPLIADSDVLVVTSFTENVVTDGVSFRFFKDMRDNVAMFKLNSSNSTVLTQDLLPTDDIIYVSDASVLGVPSLTTATFGILIVGGERITYRERDTVANTVSGLRRGSAGTAIRSHVAGASVTDVSKQSVVPVSVPVNVDYIEVWDPLVTYEVGNIVKRDGVFWHAFAVPVTGEFSSIAWSLYDKIWYAPSDSTPSNGIPLQDQDTLQALFVAGK